MAKQRSIQEDVAALKAKVKESCAQHESLETDPTIRSLRKRLKRAQRKILSAKKREADREAKTAPAQAS